MSAYAGTTQLYGRAKLEIEAAAAAVGGCAIRPGLVYSDQPAGMAGALLKVTRLPLVPLVAASARQYPVHLDDLMAAIAALAKADRLPAGPLGIANPRSVSFRDLLVALAAAEGRRPRFVPLPWRLLYWGLRAGELLRLKLPFRADSLLGLVYSAPSVPGADQVAAAGHRRSGRSASSPDLVGAPRGERGRWPSDERGAAVVAAATADVTVITAALLDRSAGR